MPSSPTRIKSLIVERGLLVKNVAADSGLPRVTLSEIITRRRSAWPKARRAIAETLNVVESEIFEADGRAIV